MKRRAIVVAILASVFVAGSAPVGGAGAACIWRDQVIINSNNSYKLNAASGQNAVKFVINSQCRLQLQYNGNGGVNVLSRSVALIGYRGQDSEARVEVQNMQGTKVVDSFVIAPPPNQGATAMSGNVTSQPNSEFSTLMKLMPGRLSFPALMYEAAGFPETQNLIPDTNAYQFYCDISGGNGVVLAGRWDRSNYKITQLNVTTEALPTNFTFNTNVPAGANSFPEQNLLAQALHIFTGRNPAYQNFKYQLDTLTPNSGSKTNTMNGYNAQLGFTKYQFQLHRQTPCPPQ